jgi:methyl-accepting chemotaxis protein
MLRMPHISLKLKLLLSTLGVTFILSGVSAYFLSSTIRVAESQKEENLKSEVELISYGISTQFFERYGDVQAFAQNSALLDQSAENRPEISRILNEYVRLYGIYTAIIYVGVDGSFIASNTRGPEGKELNLEPLRTSHADAPWFKAALNGQFSEDKSKGLVGTFVEQPDIDRLSSAVYGTEQFGNSFTTQVKGKNGKIIGVLTNRADFGWVEDEIIEGSKRLSLHGFGDARISLMDSAARVVADHSKGEVIVRRTKLLSSSDGEARSLAAVRDDLLSRPEGLGAVQEGKNTVAVGVARRIDGPKMISSLGWTALVRSSREVFLADLENVKTRLLLVLFVLAVIFTVLSWFFSDRISRNFMHVADRLGAAADASHKTSVSLTRASQSVSNSSTDQSAAVQETVSSMSEITSMIAQTNVNVKECTQIASRVAGRSEQGNQTMRRLASAMDSVNHANSQLQNMANIISEVSAKTMVINDIVFKTQLLSINASIEAARAGQHGKGFAVVAEEVGNLAQMSGNAAKEIQLLISDSQKQVLQIIEVTQSRSKESQSVSQEAVHAFSEIASGIIAINERLKGVTQATHEQEIGIQQISVAMTQMDQSTQRNSSLAAEANNLATDIGEQSEMNSRIVKALRTIVMGHRASLPAKATNLIDKLIDESESNESRGLASTKAESAMKGNLVSLMGRFESKIKASDQPAEAKPEDQVDAEDDSFKKPA